MFQGGVFIASGDISMQKLTKRQVDEMFSDVQPASREDLIKTLQEIHTSLLKLTKNIQSQLDKEITHKIAEQMRRTRTPIEPNP